MRSSLGRLSFLAASFPVRFGQRVEGLLELFTWSFLLCLPVFLRVYKVYFLVGLRLWFHGHFAYFLVWKIIGGEVALCRREPWPGSFSLVVLCRLVSACCLLGWVLLQHAFHASRAVLAMDVLRSMLVREVLRAISSAVSMSSPYLVLMSRSMMFVLNSSSSILLMFWYAQILGLGFVRFRHYS